MADMTGWQLWGAVIQIVGSIVTVGGLGHLAWSVRDVIVAYLGVAPKRDTEVLGATATATIHASAGVVLRFELTGRVEDKLDQIEQAIRDLRDADASTGLRLQDLARRDDEIEAKAQDLHKAAVNHADSELRKQVDQARWGTARDVCVALGGLVLTIAGQFIALGPFW